MELRGIPFYMHKGQIVEVDGDVLGIIEDIKRIDSRLAVYWNEYKDEFMVIEHCLDDTDRLVFSAKELDQRVVDRLMLADQWRGRSDPGHVLGDDEDFLALVEKSNADFFKKQHEDGMDKIRDAGERIAWAMEYDGRGTKAMIAVPRDINGSSD